MLFVGIDIGKNNHVASMLDENGKVVFKAFSFPNTTNGGNALLSKLFAYSSNLFIPSSLRKDSFFMS